LKRILKQILFLFLKVRECADTQVAHNKWALTCHSKIRLGSKLLLLTKHCNLFCRFINDEERKFCEIEARHLQMISEEGINQGSI